MSLSSLASVGRSNLIRKSIASAGRASPRIHHYPPRGHIHKSEHKIGPRGVPPISVCVQDMEDRTLITLAAIEDHSAREEILKRHIMDVDNVSYTEACKTFKVIARHNIHGYHLVTLPYKVGMFTAGFVGLMAMPMVFHLPTVEWFNEFAVTTDHPELRDLETPLEVSIWSWNWMEPPLGTLSFILLCLQYIRGQMVNLGIKPYTGWMKSHRGKKLAAQFPQYDSKILSAFSETANLVDYNKERTVKYLRMWRSQN